MTAFTKRLIEAIDYARIAHAGQARKGTDIPYLSHLLGVTSLVIAYGGSEDQAIAAMLHDVVEDCGAGHETAIRAEFGDAVARIVMDCTDGTAEGKANHTDVDARRREWLIRKLAHLTHVRQEPDESLLVSACDKLHNASAIAEDLENPAVGAAVFDRFTPTREQTLGYYQALGEILTERSSPVARAFEREVARMHAHAGVARRLSLGELSRGSPLPQTRPGPTRPTRQPTPEELSTDKRRERAMGEAFAETLNRRVQAGWHPEDHRDDPETDPAKDVKLPPS